METSEERPTLSGTHVGPVRFEHRQDALGLGTGTPRLSWQIASDAPDFRLAASELELTHPGGQRELALLETADQVLVAWPFPPLPSRAQATVRVRVSDGAGWSGWSEPSALEVGLLSPEDWSARFVSPCGIGGAIPSRNGDCSLLTSIASPKPMPSDTPCSRVRYRQIPGMG